MIGCVVLFSLEALSWRCLKPNRMWLCTHRSASHKTASTTQTRLVSFCRVWFSSSSYGCSHFPYLMISASSAPDECPHGREIIHIRTALRAVHQTLCGMLIQSKS